MTITGDTFLLSIQKAFTERFQKLTIEFFISKKSDTTASSIEDLILSTLCVKVLNPGFKDKVLIFFENEQVLAFENRMEKEFGLHVQVKSRNKNEWVPTNTTYAWTLAQQNDFAT